MKLSRAWSVRRCAAIVAMAAVGTAVQAADFLSVGNEPAVLYDAPTLRGTKVSVAPRGMPVEIVVAQADWVRVRDAGGSLSWIERKSLVVKRTVVATDPGPVDVHAAADDASPVVYRVASGVLLDLAGAPAGGWVGVRDRDGATGFVHVGRVWGE